MKILLTGATGYIGKRLLPGLIDRGYEVVCCARDKNRFNPPDAIKDKITVIEVDFQKKGTLSSIPKDIDAAYFLMHSMSASSNYMEIERQVAINFREAINQTTAKQVVYLSGIINEDDLSDHLASRKAVEDELASGTFSLTTFRAGVIIGSGSASFEIIRDLVEKLPVMITPKWLHTKCQPIGVRDVIYFLIKTLFEEKTYNRNFDIGGSDQLSYKDMLLGFAKVRGLKRSILILPVMTPRLSSYWLYFVTSTSYKLAIALVNSMKIETVCRESDINQILDIQPISYEESLRRTFRIIEGNEIISSWKDSLVSGRFKINISEFVNVPTYGCFVDKRTRSVSITEATIDKIWRIGGNQGWYYATWLWRIRGFIDKLFGGVGLRRGRTHIDKIEAGDTLDFWRVLYSNQDEGRLLLFAEMKLPGEAWLEFKVVNGQLTQTATFRPIGIMGRLYWYSVLPFHAMIFRGMANRLAS